MKHDNAIKKVLERSDVTLSFDFETRTMKRIQKVIEKRKKKAYAMQLFLVSIVSASLIFVVFYIFNNKLDVNLRFGEILSVVSKVRSHSFELYIAFLALLLLFVDGFLRKSHKYKNDNSVQVDKK